MSRMVIGNLHDDAGFLGFARLAKKKKKKKKSGLLKKIGSRLKGTTKLVGAEIGEGTKKTYDTAEEALLNVIKARRKDAETGVSEALSPEDESDLDEAEAELDRRERELDEAAASGLYDEALVGELETILRVTRNLEIQAAKKVGAPVPEEAASSGMVRIGQINPMVLAQHGPGIYQAKTKSWAEAMSERMDPKRRMVLGNIDDWG